MLKRQAKDREHEVIAPYNNRDADATSQDSGTSPINLGNASGKTTKLSVTEIVASWFEKLMCRYKAKAAKG